jgi:hypothetical protein
MDGFWVKRLFRPIVKLGRARALVRSHFLRVLEVERIRL